MMESKDTWKQDAGEAEAGKSAKGAAGMPESGFWQKRPEIHIGAAMVSADFRSCIPGSAGRTGRHGRIIFCPGLS